MSGSGSSGSGSSVYERRLVGINIETRRISFRGSIGSKFCKEAEEDNCCIEESVGSGSIGSGSIGSSGYAFETMTLDQCCGPITEHWPDEPCVLSRYFHMTYPGTGIPSIKAMFDRAVTKTYSYSLIDVGGGAACNWHFPAEVGKPDWVFGANNTGTTPMTVTLLICGNTFCTGTHTTNAQYKAIQTEAAAWDGKKPIVLYWFSATGGWESNNENDWPAFVEFIPGIHP